MLALACVSANQEYSLRLIRINGDVIRQIDPPDGRSRMDDPAFSPDGKFLGFWAGPADGPDGGTLYTVPTAGGTPEPLLKGTEQQTTGTDADMVYSPDGRYVALPADFLPPAHEAKPTFSEPGPTAETSSV